MEQKLNFHCTRSRNHDTLNGMNEIFPGSGIAERVFAPEIVTIQDVQPNRPQTRALHALSLHSQLLSEANGRSAHSKMKIHPIANEFA